MDAKDVVENIKREIERGRDQRTWDDLVNSLNLVSQVVFTRSSGFILEFMQNAEDAGLGAPGPGVFNIRLKEDKVTIQHNGMPFSAENVSALSGIRSSKKPERGTLGYLGIGFKSVFKVSDCPQVYSGDFRFKFDKGAWPDPTSTPWHIIPLWIEEERHPVESDLTIFDIPLKDARIYPGLREEVSKIRTELFLFLKWLKKIEITDQPSGKTWTLENLGEDAKGITILTQEGQKQRFRFFRRLVTVPEPLKQDPLTQQYRKNVTQREIAIAFALDENGNLAPSTKGAMYGGVYSFVPLGEAISGAKFPIQADFLVQPGRDAINYEAPWNHWLMREIVELCKEAIQYFKSDPLLKFQFLQAFDFTQNTGQESYEKLFGPMLVEPIQQFLREDACVPAYDGSWTYLGKAVRLAEDKKAREDLVRLGILSMDKVASVLGDKDDLVLIDPLVREGESQRIGTVDRRDLLRNDTFLVSKASEADGTTWFRSLCLWLGENPVRNITQSYSDYRVSDEEYRRKWLPQDGRTFRSNLEPYHDYKFVLAADNQLHEGGSVYIPELNPKDPLVAELANSLQKTRPILHPSILGAAQNERERSVIRSLLTGRGGVQTLDAKKVCQEAVLPKIVTKGPKPSAKDLARLTGLCLDYLQPWDLASDVELWVLTKRRGVQPAKEVVFGPEYETGQDWETYRQYVPGVTFLTPKYLPPTPPKEAVTKMREFFARGGVKAAPDNGVEDFGVNFTLQELKGSGVQAKRIDKRNFGYDLRGRRKAEKMMRIEVKGQTHDQDVELTGNEAGAADTHKGEFYLAVVSGIPNSPALYVLNNPALIGKKDRLVVGINSWKSQKWK